MIRNMLCKIIFWGRMENMLLIYIMEGLVTDHLTKLIIMFQEQHSLRDEIIIIQRIMILQITLVGIFVTINRGIIGRDSHSNAECYANNRRYKKN